MVWRRHLPGTDAWSRLALTVVLMLTLASTVQAAGDYCEEMTPTTDYGGGHYGPFDYANPEHRAKFLAVVENHHFGKNVQSLRSGETTTTAGGDLEYVLMSFPNHHPALGVLIRLSFKENRDRPIGMQYNAECWFQRAMQWRPDDAIVRVIYGNYLMQKQKLDAAIEQYRVAEQMGFSNANLFYSLGLALFEKKDFTGSLKYAQQAYAAGYPLPALREKLKRAGVWQEP